MIFRGPKLLCCGTSPWLCTAAKILPARPGRQNIDRAEDPLYYCAFKVNFSSKIGLSVPLWIHRKKNAGKEVRSVMKEADWKKKKKKVTSCKSTCCINLCAGKAPDAVMHQAHLESLCLGEGKPNWNSEIPPLIIQRNTFCQVTQNVYIYSPAISLNLKVDAASNHIKRSTSTQLAFTLLKDNTIFAGNHGH